MKWLNFPSNLLSRMAGSGFSAQDKLLYVALLTSPESNPCGLIEVSLSDLAYTTELSRTAIQDSLIKLQESELLTYDLELVYLRQMCVNFSWERFPHRKNTIARILKTYSGSPSEAFAAWCRDNSLDDSEFVRSDHKKSVVIVPNFEVPLSEVIENSKAPVSSSQLTGSAQNGAALQAQANLVASHSEPISSQVEDGHMSPTSHQEEIPIPSIRDVTTIYQGCSPDVPPVEEGKVIREKKMDAERRKRNMETEGGVGGTNGVNAKRRPP